MREVADAILSEMTLVFDLALVLLRIGGSAKNVDILTRVGHSVKLRLPSAAASTFNLSMLTTRISTQVCDDRNHAALCGGSAPDRPA